MNKIDFVLETLTTLYVTYDDRDSEKPSKMCETASLKNLHTIAFCLTLGKSCVKSVYLLIANDTQVSITWRMCFSPSRACCCGAQPPEWRTAS